MKSKYGRHFEIWNPDLLERSIMNLNSSLKKCLSDLVMKNLSTNVIIRILLWNKNKFHWHYSQVTAVKCKCYMQYTDSFPHSPHIFKIGDYKIIKIKYKMSGKYRFSYSIIRCRLNYVKIKRQFFHLNITAMVM